MVDPCQGSRRLVTVLKRDHGVDINRKRLQRMRREIGHEAIWCKPRTSIPDDGHRKYPYLLRHLTIMRPDHVWCTDITYVPMPGGHAYAPLRAAPSAPASQIRVPRHSILDPSSMINYLFPAPRHHSLV